MTSDGGGGHKSVSKALEQFLQPDYSVKRENLILGILHSLDPIRKISFNKCTGEDFYDYCLKRKWVYITNNLVRLGRRLILFSSGPIERLLGIYLDQEKPDMIISVMPFFNFAFFKEAKKRKIPFIIVTNDLDSSNYPLGLHNPQYDKFKYILTFDDKDVKKKISKANFNSDQVISLGFPLRPDFFDKKNVKNIKKDFNIPLNKPVAMLLMGATGSDSGYVYAKHISKINFSLHLVICLGKNQKLGNKIAKLKLNNNVSISTVGFTDRISDLMAASDLVITKSGPNSVVESIYMNKPVLIDNTNSILFWEQLNLDFVTKNNFGEPIKRYEDINPLLDKYLRDKEYYSKIKKNLTTFKKINFGASIKSLVTSMLQQ